MDRIPDLDEALIDVHQAYNLAGCANGEDNDLPVAERRDRAEVIVGSNLKIGDDIMLVDAIPLRVIGPGRGALTILAYYPAWFGDTAMSFELDPTSYLTDRAPLDPNEAPMPVFPEPLVLSLLAAKAGKPNPSEATTAERKRAARRKLVAFVERQPEPARTKLREALIKHGHLERPRPLPWICRAWRWLTGR